MRAVLRPARQARRALVAARVGHDDPLAGPKGRDRRSHLFDDSHALVPGDDRERYGVRLVADVQIRPAHPRGRDSHEHLVMARRFQIEALDDESAAGSGDDRRAYLHGVAHPLSAGRR
nr:hypothetical protein [Spongiactinospora rosea]